jgi:ABC-type multidrug transport system permease subunit
LNQLSIIYPTIIKEWKTKMASTGLIYKYLGEAARSAALAWIIYQSGATQALPYLAVGIALMSIWGGVLAFGGWSLEGEIYGKTLDYTLISPSPMSSVLLIKTLAQALYEIPTGIVCFGTALLVAREIPHVANIPAFSFSLALALAGLIMVGFFFSALVVLVGGKAGIFMGILPLVAVLSGFILPVTNLPIGMEVLARFTPSSWAMDAVWSSIGGIESWVAIITSWGTGMVVTIGWFLVTIYLCVAVEKRIRITGSLSAES